MRVSLLFLLSFACLLANNFYYEYGQKVEVTKISNARSNSSSVEYYLKSNGVQVGIKKDEILLKCKEGMDCATLLSSYNFASVENLANSIFLVKLQSDQDVFSYAQRLYSDEKIEFAHPNFVKERKRR